MAAEKARAWIEVDLAALRRNAETIARHCGTRILPMVKADAYGIGVGPVVRTLEALDPWGYGVATVAEGEELRALGIARPVVIFSPITADEFDDAGRASLTPTLGDVQSIRAWGGRGPWHLSLDTGMLRAGAAWRDVGALRGAIAEYPPQGAYTHFHSAENDAGTIAVQERRFAEAVAKLPVTPELLHTDNSAAIVRRGRSERPVVRPGIFLYGAGRFAGAALVPDVVTHVRARIVDVRDAAPGDTVSYGALHAVTRDSKIATASYGHADGYPIAMTNKGEALIRGRRVPVVGRVTMDMTMLDVTGVECARGDVVTFAGRDGDETISLDDIAGHGRVSPYEVLVRMRNRVPRIYLNG